MVTQVVNLYMILIWFSPVNWCWLLTSWLTRLGQRYGVTFSFFHRTNQCDHLWVSGYNKSSRDPFIPKRWVGHQVTYPSQKGHELNHQVGGGFKYCLFWPTTWGDDRNWLIFFPLPGCTHQLDTPVVYWLIFFLFMFRFCLNTLSLLPPHIS